MILLRLVRWELFKLSRQRGSYIGFALSLVFVIVMMIGFKLSHWHYFSNFKLGFDPLELLRGPFFAHYSLQIGFFAFLPLLAATLGGSMIAGEAQSGTLRNLLVRPPSRTALFAAKTIATFVWLQLNVFFLVALALLVGRIAFGGGPMLVFVWELRRDGPWVLESPDYFVLLATVTFGCGVSLFVVSAMSLLLSTLTDTPVIAHVGSLGAFFISSVVQRLPDQLMPDDVRALLPTTHMNFWHQLFRLWDPAGTAFDATAFWTDLAYCATFTVIVLGAALAWFRRKDITS